MKALTIIFSFLLFSISNLYSQTSKQLFGQILDQEGESLIGATVQWEGTAIGTITDENGNFWLPKLDTAASLQIQYVGYDPMLVRVNPGQDSIFAKIESVAELDVIQVSERRLDNFTSTLSTINLESITSGELKKAACCSLAESFETSASVDVMRQDAVTSATEIQMLGLRGIYSQLLVEKRPAFTGLGSPLALEFVPGTWVESIQVSKGASTVQNGPQAMTGQINIEMMKPNRDKPLFINLFGSTTERGEMNLHLNKKWNKSYSSGLLLHGSTTQGKFDRNNDTFLDQPLKKTLTGLWRNTYEGNNFHAELNVQGVYDDRIGGQLIPEGEINPDNYYRINQDNRRVDVFGKFGYFGFEKPETSVAIIYGGSVHDTKNLFGKTRYNGKQQNLYTNLLYSSFLGTTDHKVNIGASFQYDNYDEFLDDTDFSRTEAMPGAFGEYVYNTDKFGLIAGLRADYLNISGPRGGQAAKSKAFVTPRLNLKYNFTDESILRLSGGRGVRSAQFLSENMAVLASNRLLVVTEELGVEDAWNVGLNYTQNFRLAGRSAGIVLDFYRTDFINQVVMDMESVHGSVLFYNLDGKSYSNSLLVMGSWAPFPGFDMKLAYKLNDVKVTYQNNLRERPMVAANRALATFNYETPSRNWMFNTNIQYTGKQRFADASHIPPTVEDRQYFEGYSPDYALVNAQVTRRFRNFEVYVGGENLTNYRQQHAIIDWERPFGEYFDAMQVWGPLMGVRGYVGARIWLD